MASTLARKFRADVTTDLTLASGFLQLNGLTDFDPEVTPNLEDSTAYDTNGISSSEPTMQDGVVTATFLRRIVSTTYDPGQELVRACIAQFGTAARCGIRWYDKNGGPETGSAVVIPTWKRAATGVKNLESITVTFTVTDGVLNLNITNPGTAATVPLIISATPTAQSVGKPITLTGSGFLGTTGITIGGVSVATGAFTVYGDSSLVFVVPAGSAGSAPLIVTNAVGASASTPYTRGA